MKAGTDTLASDDFRLPHPSVRRRTQSGLDRGGTQSRATRQVLLIAWKEFSDRLRSGWVLSCVLVWLGAIALTSLFGLVQVGQIGFQGYERTTVSLLNVVQYLVPLLGLLLGHDLLVAEREERTLPLLLACGVPRHRVLLGKYVGGCVTVAFPLGLGFGIAGSAIGLAATHSGLGFFLKLAISGLLLGAVFLGLGMMISSMSRSRVQALVLALLAWGIAVFVFDLAALGVVVTMHSTAAAREVEAVTDATHVNSMADVHNAFENGDDAAQRARATAPKGMTGWLMANPVDAFRAVNLPESLGLRVPWSSAVLALVGWVGGCLIITAWRYRRLDL